MGGISMTDKGKMIEAVYKDSLTKRATLVVFYLINRADKELTCFPGIKTIASDCNMSKRTVQRALNDLIEAKMIIKDSRFRKNGGQSSNLFTLCINDQISDDITNVEENVIDSEKQYDMDKVDFDDYSSDIDNEKTLFINQRVQNKVPIINAIKPNEIIMCHWEGDGLVPP